MLESEKSSRNCRAMSPTSLIGVVQRDVRRGRDVVLEDARRRCRSFSTSFERQRHFDSGAGAVAGACHVTLAPVPLKVPDGRRPVKLQLRDRRFVVAARPPLTVRPSPTSAKFAGSFARVPWTTIDSNAGRLFAGGATAPAAFPTAAWARSAIRRGGRRPARAATTAPRAGHYARDGHAPIASGARDGASRTSRIT